jgi:DNA-binding protein HU-beta
MNKTELVEALASRATLTKADAARAVDALTAVIGEELAKGGQVSILGFGTFAVTQRAARTGKNPKTGEALQIAARKAPKFSAGATLKKTVAG